MGNAKFWYYPNPAGNRLVTIDMGEALAELFSEWRKDADGGISLDGSSYRSVGLTQEIVTIQRDRMALGEDLAHKFRALQSHLDNGYTCSFSADSAKAWCGYLKTSPLNSGSTSIQVSSNPFNSFVGSNVLASDDYVAFDTQPPAAINEISKIASLSSGFSATNGGTITLSRGTAFRYDVDTWVRWYRFWPVMKRPIEDIGQNIINNEHGMLWSLNLRLEVDYGGWFAFMPPGFDKIDELVVFPSETGSDYYESGFAGLDIQVSDRMTSNIKQVDVGGLDSNQYYGSHVRRN